MRRRHCKIIACFVFFSKLRSRVFLLLLFCLEGRRGIRKSAAESCNNLTFLEGGLFLPKKFLEGRVGDNLDIFQPYNGGHQQKEKPQKVYFLEQIWYMEGGEEEGGHLRSVRQEIDQCVQNCCFCLKSSHQVVQKIVLSGMRFV